MSDMNPQQVVVGIYLALEKCGGRNLIDRSRAAARAAGVSFSNADATRWLAPFQSARGRRTDIERPANGRGFVREADVQKTADGPGSDSRANNVSLVTKIETTSQQMDLIPEFKTPRVAKQPSDGDLGAWAIRDAIGDLVAPMLNGMTLAAWKAANGKAARSLHDAQKSAADVVAFWKSHVGYDGRPFLMLSELQKAMAKAALQPRSHQSQNVYQKPKPPDPYEKLIRRKQEEQAMAGGYAG